MSVRLDRQKAADLGVQISDSADALRLLVGGDSVTTYNEAGEQYEVHLRAEEQDRGSKEAIARLTVPSSRLGAVPLENIASFVHGEAPADIRRLNRQRQVTIGANMLPGTSQSAAQQPIAAEASQTRLRSGNQTRVCRPLARAQSHGKRISPGARTVVDLHVSGAGGAVRIVAAPGHDSAVVAVDAPVRVAVDRDLRPVVEHLFGAGHAGALRRGQEELDSADRPRQPAEGRRIRHT